MRQKMNKTTIVLSLMLAVVSVIALFFGVKLHEEHLAKKRSTEKQLAEAYATQNRLFYINMISDEYAPYDDSNDNYRYIDFRYYQHITGEKMTIEMVREYYSRQYEEDGSVRIYTNRRHDHIKKYLEWAQQHQIELETFLDALIEFKKEVQKTYPTMSEYIFFNFSLHNLEELINFYFDPAYTPNFIFE